ncbi:MAG: TIGR04255 family protein [Candidatus Thiodiazotropha sp. (ex Lucinoma borealis)]|nr:TIGR04255 family protein [Candidatus Thiodiazotropha sp. (ex Lucinoma borealis)]
MYETTCYEESFLKEVIFRVDFPSPIESIEKTVPKGLGKAILNRFPISEPRKAHTQEFQFTGPSFQAKSTELTQWVYFGKEREKSLILEPGSLVISIKEYKSYEELIDDIKDVLEAFFEAFSDTSVARVGLRYVNLIDLKEPEPLSWAEHINEEILGIIDFHDEKQNLTRVFHIVEYNFDGLAVKYQFGLANPDYPALIKKKQFVMDIDAYSNGSFDFGDVMSGIGDAHEKVQEIFEKSITEKLRQTMKPKDNV